MRRLFGRTILVFGAYAALLLAIVIAGFIGQAVGIWASILWIVVLIAGLAFYWRQKRHEPSIIATESNS